MERGRSCRLMFMQKKLWSELSVFFISHAFVVKGILTCIYLLFILSHEGGFHRVVLQREALYRTFYLLHIKADREREGSRRKGS